MAIADERLSKILLDTCVIAMVGASVRPDRPSFRVGTYMATQGYRVIPVNPGHAGETLFGDTVVASLDAVPDKVDMLNVFRRSDQIAPVVREGLEALSGLKYVWMQLGLSNAEGRKLAEDAGLSVVEDNCLLIEHRRLIRPR